MNTASIYEFRNGLANYLKEISESDRPLIVSRFGRPVALVSPYKDNGKNSTKDFFGFLGKGGNGDKFLARVRRSAREETYVKSFG